MLSVGFKKSHIPSQRNTSYNLPRRHTQPASRCFSPRSLYGTFLLVASQDQAAFPQQCFSSVSVKQVNNHIISEHKYLLECLTASQNYPCRASLSCSHFQSHARHKRRSRNFSKCSHANGLTSSLSSYRKKLSQRIDFKRKSCSPCTMISPSPPHEASV